MKLLPNAARGLGRLFCHGRASSKLLQSACWSFAQGAQNAHNYAMDRNGEVWLIRRLASGLGGRSVLDIGANMGNWSAAVREAAPNAHIWAVEMIPAFAESIRERFGNAVPVLECAVGETSGYITAYKLGGGGRVVPGKTTKTREPIEVPLRTGDDLVTEAKIANLGLVKLDVEGYDVPALRGLRATIERDRPVLQFEYGRFYIDTRHYLRDAYDLLEPLGYRIGRLMPRHIDFMPWSRAQETFLTNNYVAVPSERTI